MSAKVRADHSYLKLREAASAYQSQGQYHLEAYQTLVQMHNVNSGHGAIAFFAADYDFNSPVLPVDVISLGDIDHEVLKSIILPRIEYHRVALQRCDRQLADISRELVAKQNMQATQQHAAQSPPSPQLPATEGEQPVMSEAAFDKMSAQLQE